MQTLYVWLDGGRDACVNMGIDEAMLHEASRGVTLLRLYWFEPHAVTIGYFQRLLDAVDLEACRWYGVKVVRRITGGGSVYHDTNGEITYSIAAPSGVLGDVTVPESFRILASWIVRGLARLGLRAEFAGFNDILVNGRKVSGNAQARRLGAVLQHGTLMYATNLEVLKRVLRVPGGKGRRIEERVTTLTRELGRRVDRREVIEALLEGIREWARELGLHIAEAPDELVERLVETGRSLSWRYCSGEWLWRR